MATLEIPVPDISFDMQTNVETKFRARLGSSKYGFIVNSKEPLTNTQVSYLLHELFQFKEEYRITETFRYPTLELPPEYR